MSVLDGLHQYPPRGTAEDLLSILARAEALRYKRLGVTVPFKPESLMAKVEPFGNLVGLAFRSLGAVLPASWMLALEDRIYAALAGKSRYTFDDRAPGLAAAARLAEAVEKERGTRPALLAVLSHPPVTGEWLGLNVEMVRHAMKALTLLRGGAARPKLVVAVDPFALDMLSAFEEGAYAGFMGTYHLGFDRLATQRRPLSRRLVGSAAWDRLPGRLSEALAAGGEVAIVLSGGVPTTTRALYAAREFVRGLCKGRPGRGAPRGCLERLRERDRSFEAFSKSGLVGPRLPVSAWRMAEAWIVALVTGAWGHEAGRSGEPDVDTGLLGREARAALLSLAGCLGWSDAAAAAQLMEFEIEFLRETPYRERLFRFLCGRVVAKGRPVVLVPLTHGKIPDIRLDWPEPAALVSASGGSVSVWGSDGGRDERTAPVDRFAREFVAARYL